MGFWSKLFQQRAQRVLVVEDDVPLRTFIASRLAENGVDVVQTGEGTGVVELVRRHEPNCIVLDVMLPGKNGMQVLGDLRAAGLATPVVVLTTLSGEGGLRMEATKHHAVFLNKADTSLEVVIDTVLRHMSPAS